MKGRCIYVHAMLSQTLLRQDGVSGNTLTDKYFLLKLRNQFGYVLNASGYETLPSSKVIIIKCDITSSIQRSQGYIPHFFCNKILTLQLLSLFNNENVLKNFPF